MKILHVAPVGHHSEGIGSVLQKLYPAQIELGNEVRIVTVYNNNIYPDWPIESITTKSRFAQYIKEWMPDIAIFHSHFQREYICFSEILKRQNIPYCVQLHGALSRSNYKKNHIKKYIAGLLFFNKILKGAETILYLNKAEYENSIVPRINPHYEIIPNGCDQQKNLELTRVVNKPIEIVFIGRICTIHKGLDLLCQAIRKLNDSCINNIHFSFYGNEDDVDVEYLKKELEVIPIAKYCGSAYGEYKDSILRKADIFILTSRYEGMPMGVLEAWSYGIPCILTAGTNMISDDVNKKAFWEADLNSESIYQTLLCAVEQYTKTPLVYRTSAFEESQKYNWDKIAAKTINVFNAIIQEGISVK